MDTKGFSEDASAILYLVPFLASGAYALYLWASDGITSILPPTVYLTVTRDPLIFAVGSLSVMLGMAIDVASADPAGRVSKLGSVSNTMHTIAGASLVLSLLSALYANGFTNVAGAATDFIVGRFSLLFPLMIVLLSYLVTAKFDLRSLRNPRVLGVLAMLLVPASVYALGRRSITLGLGGALLLFLIGIALFLMSTRKADEPGES